MKTNITLTVAEIVGFIKTSRIACQFISMNTETKAKVNKDCPYGEVIKSCIRHGLINVNYQSAVERLLGKKIGRPVSYNPGKCWYEHLQTDDGKALPLIQNKSKQDGKLYLQYYPRIVKNIQYKAANGDIIPNSDIEPYLKETKQNEFKPAVEVIELCNIKSLRARRFNIRVK